MRKWFYLAGAIVAEVVGTLSLNAATHHPAWVPLVVLAYVAAFYLLGLTLRAGLTVGVAYGFWGAAGVALVALLGRLVFGDELGARAWLGLAVIAVGVVLIETGSHAPDPDEPADAA